MDPILDDYSHRVSNKIKQCENKVGFPNLSTYNVSQEVFDDYLSDKQIILDSKGSKRTQYTIWGILVILPILIFSAFPANKLPGGEKWALFVGVGIGVVLCLLESVIMKFIIRFRLKSMRNENAEKYIKDVLNFNV